VLVLSSGDEAVKQGIEEIRSLCVLLRHYDHKLSKLIAIQLNDHLPSETNWRQVRKSLCYADDSNSSDGIHDISRTDLSTSRCRR
jgi:hypothetical protein